MLCTKKADGVYIHPGKLLSFTVKLFDRFNVDTTENIITSKSLLWADIVGRHSQGILRVPCYCLRVQSKVINSPCNPSLIKENNAIALIDGNHGLGQYLGVIGMTKAINLARKYGIGIVGIINSNHFGAGAYYVNLAAKRKMIGIAVSNSFPKVAPYGGIKAVLGTNPFSFGAPRYNNKNILIDFSTASVAGSTIREYIKKNELLSDGIAIDQEGNVINNPSSVSSGALLPFGGAKGYCLSLMVEILSGILNGGAFSHYINSMFDYSTTSGSCHTMIAINISSFIDLKSFFKRIEELLSFIKASNPHSNVFYPGEKRWKSLKESYRKGIFIDETTQSELIDFAKEYNIPLPW